MKLSACFGQKVSGSQRVRVECLSNRIPSYYTHFITNSVRNRVLFDANPIRIFDEMIFRQFVSIHFKNVFAKRGVNDSKDFNARSFWMGEPSASAHSSPRAAPLRPGNPLPNTEFRTRPSKSTTFTHSCMALNSEISSWRFLPCRGARSLEAGAERGLCPGCIDR